MVYLAFLVLLGIGAVIELASGGWKPKEPSMTSAQLAAEIEKTAKIFNGK
jgi:hypothetical protein